VEDCELQLKMKILTHSIELKTLGNAQIHDITGNVADLLEASGLKDGHAVLFVQGSTGGLTTMEFEDGLVKDLQNFMEALLPTEDDYFHNERWGDANGHAHLRASLIGPYLVVPFSKGKLLHGTWQQVVFIDFDVRPRNREIVCQLCGE